MTARIFASGLALLALFSGAAAAQSLPQGWTVQGDNQGALFAPERLKPGEGLDIWVAPPSPMTGRSLVAQLPAVREKAGATQGDDCQDPVLLSSGAASQICALGGSVVQYMLLPPDESGDVRLVRIRLAGEGVLSRYQDGMAAIIKLAMQGEAESLLERYGMSEQQLERDRIARAIHAAPGQGVPDADIAGLFVAWEDRPIPGSTMRQVVHTTYLLLKDGTAYEGLDFPPDEFDAEASRRLQPDLWLDWRRKGDGYEMRGEDGAWTDLQGWQALPAEPGERLDGAYSRSTGSGDLSSGVSTSSSTWLFYPDGRFETTSYATTGTGTLQADNGFSSTSSTLSNAEGTQTTTGGSATGTSDPNATPVIAGGTQTQTDDGPAHTGRYRLDGWVMEISRDNGVTERFLISFQDDKRDVIDIDGQPYRLP